MNFDPEDADLQQKPLKKKPKREPYVLVPLNISRTVDFLYKKLAEHRSLVSRPNRKRKCPGQRKAWNQGQTESQ